MLLQKNGIYTEKIEAQGIKFIDFEFEMENNLNFEKINEFVRIIKENDIEEVHIQKFLCILIAFPACVLAQVPYIAYVHDSLNASYEWYLNNYDIFKIMFKIFFNNANKVITIKEDVKKYIMERFEVPEEKCKMIYNSIDFNLYKYDESKNIQKINNIVLISRLSTEKYDSIKSGIDFFEEYHKINPNAFLTIVGDGNIRKEIEEYVKEKQNIKMVGQSNDINNIIINNDAVLGIGRCILEAIALKRLPIIAGHINIKGIVSRENIEDCVKSNLNGANLENANIHDLVKYIYNLDMENIKEIVDDNYNFAYKRLNTNSNTYTIDEEIECTHDMYTILEGIEKLQDNRIKMKEEINQYEEYKKQDKEYIVKIEKELEKLTARLEEKSEIKQELNKVSKEADTLKMEIDNIYNSKRWKFLTKISKIIKR